MHRIEERDRGAAAAQAGQFLAHVLDGAVHALLDFGVQTLEIVDIHSVTSAGLVGRRLRARRDRRADRLAHDDAPQVARLRAG